MQRQGLRNLWKKPHTGSAGAAQVMALAILSTGLVYTGFFVAGVSFAVATIPFFFAILTRSKLSRFALAASYFGAIAVISCWGLARMGYDPLWVIPAGVAATVMISLIFAYFGVGLACLALMLLPFFPGNPLLATGSILPGTGLFGLLALPLAIIGIERIPRPVLRGCALAGLIVIGPLWGLLGIPASTPDRGQPAFSLATLDISDVLAVTDWGYHTRLAGRMMPGHSYITGENLVSSDNQAAIALWCRLVTENNLTVFLGVRNATKGAANGQGQMWRFDAQTCPQPTLEYAASIGIPGLTGGLWPGPAPTPATYLPDTSFLACFEGFSLYRWMQIGFTGSREVITFSNDHWTAPLKPGRLRRKIARQFEQLFGIKTAHAEAGKTMLVMKLPERTD